MLTTSDVRSTVSDMREEVLKAVTISTRIEPDLRDEIQELAAGGDRTFSQEVRRALRWYVLAESVNRERESAA